MVFLPLSLSLSLSSSLYLSVILSVPCLGMLVFGVVVMSNERKSLFLRGVKVVEMCVGTTSLLSL